VGSGVAVEGRGAGHAVQVQLQAVAAVRTRFICCCAASCELWCGVCCVGEIGKLRVVAATRVQTHFASGTEAVT